MERVSLADMTPLEMGYGPQVQETRGPWQEVRGPRAALQTWDTRRAGNPAPWHSLLSREKLPPTDCN